MGKHYVPQEYLRGFATSDDPDQIWMFDKVTARWSRAAIDKVAQERDYFTPEVEARLTAEVESPANIALKKLRRDNALSDADRRALAVYIAVMIKRVPGRRRKASALIPGALESTVAELRRDVTEAIPEDDPRRIHLFEEIDRAERNLRENTPPEVLRQITDPWISREMLAAIDRMVWRFVLRPGSASRFITSDNPAYYFEAYGVGTEHAELTFSISSKLALIGNHQGTARSTMLVRVPKEWIKEINRRVASGAERFVFSAHRASWIETLALRRDPYLSRIVW
jgi:hypothetical protein